MVEIADRAGERRPPAKDLGDADQLVAFTGDEPNRPPAPGCLESSPCRRLDVTTGRVCFDEDGILLDQPKGGRPAGEARLGGRRFGFAVGSNGFREFL